MPAEITTLDNSGGKSGPLSYGQRALWFLQKVSPDNCAYNIVLAARITGPLDTTLLRRSFQTLIGRHSSLAAVFPEVAGRPIQRVRDDSEICFELRDASGLEWQTLRRQLCEEGQRPFNLETGPILRILLFSRSTVDNVLLLVVHHIAVDYASVQQAMKELGEIYSARLVEKEPILPRLSLTYIDYAKWQTDMLAGPQGSALSVYWRSRLSCDLSPINLPFDRPRQQAQTFRGDTYDFAIDDVSAAQVSKLVQELDGSLFTVLLSVFYCLLHFWTGQRDILVGSPPIGKRRPEFNGVVGFFHNPVVLRGELTPSESFDTLHRRTQAVVEGALNHQDYPFSYLVEQISPVRDPSYSPIFQVMFVLYDRAVSEGKLGDAQQAASLELAGLDVEFLEIEEPVSMLDLTMTLVEEVETLTGSIQFNSDLFDRSTIESFANEFTNILRGAGTDPFRMIEELRTLQSGSNESASHLNRAAEDDATERANLRREMIRRGRRQPVRLELGD